MNSSLISTITFSVSLIIIPVQSLAVTYDLTGSFQDGVTFSGFFSYPVNSSTPFSSSNSGFGTENLWYLDMWDISFSDGTRFIGESPNDSFYYFQSVGFFGSFQGITLDNSNSRLTLRFEPNFEDLNVSTVLGDFSDGANAFIQIVDNAEVTLRNSTSTPEPSTFLGLGLLGLGLLRQVKL